MIKTFQNIVTFLNFVAYIAVCIKNNGNIIVIVELEAWLEN